MTFEANLPKINLTSQIQNLGIIRGRRTFVQFGLYEGKEIKFVITSDNELGLESLDHRIDSFRKRIEDDQETHLETLNCNKVVRLIDKDDIKCKAFLVGKTSIKLTKVKCTPISGASYHLKVIAKKVGIVIFLLLGPVTLWGPLIFLLYKKSKKESYFAIAAQSFCGGTAFFNPRKVFSRVLTSCEKNNRIKLEKSSPRNFVTAYQKYVKNTSPSTSELDKLKKNECLIFNASTSHHNMTGMFIKQGDGQYSYYHFNSGYGLSHHPMNGAGKYATPMIINGISLEKAKEFLSFCNSHLYVFLEANIDDMYKKIRGLGEVWKPRDYDEKYWAYDQVGGSCSGQSERIMMQLMLTEESYANFDQELKVFLVYKLYHRIEAGLDTSYRTRRVVLDILLQINPGALVDEQMSEQLTQMKAKLEKVTHKSRPLSLSSHLSRKRYRTYAQAAKSLKEVSLKERLKNEEDGAVVLGFEAIFYYFSCGKYQKGRELLIDLYGLSQSPYVKKQMQEKSFHQIFESFKALHAIVKEETSIEEIDLFAGVMNFWSRNGYQNGIRSSAYSDYIVLGIKDILPSVWSGDIESCF